MSQMLAKIGISLLCKLITETFLAKITIEVLNSWAKTTENKLDDKVVAAAAEAFDVPIEKLMIK